MRQPRFGHCTVISLEHNGIASVPAVEPNGKFSSKSVTYGLNARYSRYDMA